MNLIAGGPIEEHANFSSSESEAFPKPRVMVVDDTPVNLRLLDDILTGAGYAVRGIADPKHTCEAAAKERPDIILLDIDMPELDGFAVCRQLKEHPATRDIPVIFISAFSDTDYKLEAFLVGGVDYVTKPFRAAEVKARVRAHVELARTRRQLAENLQRLQQLEALRDSLTHMLVHDLRTPLNAMSLTLEVLSMDERLDEELQADVLAAKRCGTTLKTGFLAILTPKF